MRFFTARRLALTAVLPVLFSFSVIPGCSKQSEGERCGNDIGTSDSSECDDGLVCTQIDVNARIYRCCNTTHVTNARCVPVVTTVASGGASGAGGASSGGKAGASAAGASAAGASAAGASAEAGAAGEPSAVADSGAGGV